jgi:hypothetical protein
VGRALDGVSLATGARETLRGWRESGASCILFNGGYHDRAALAVAAVPIADSMAEAVPELLRWATELRRPSDAEAS